MPGTLEIIGQLIEVIHRSLGDMQVQIDELKTHDNSDIRYRVFKIEKQISELTILFREKDMEDQIEAK